jgi:hypothetical protein
MADEPTPNGEDAQDQDESHELNALLESRRWVKRRVDQVEFLDLTTVRRTIAFTLDLGALAALPLSGSRDLIPLGWFAPWANAGAVLLDASQHVVPYLTSEESDCLVERQIKERLNTVGVASSKMELVKKVRLHRKDPGIPGCACKSCNKEGCEPGYAELMVDKWGCLVVRELLEELCPPCKTPTDGTRRELAQILLAWQTNFVLLARLDAPRQSGLMTLRLSFDEELRKWEPPWERRKRVLKPIDLTCAESRQWRRHISRGGPFEKYLDALFPRRLRGFLARRKCLRLRSIGRRGFLALAWHVSWHQASGIDTPSHQVDVVLPSELMAVRMRLLRMRDGKCRANVADQVGSRATIVAPDVSGDEETPAPPPPPTLFSLVITQRSAAAWYGGAWLALLTGIAILTTALWWLPTDSSESTDAITILIVAPTLVATLLSVRARSEIAEQLTRTLRRLIGAVGVLAAICAVSLLAQPDPVALEWLWIKVAVVLLIIAATLWFGAYRIRHYMKFGRRPSPREVPVTEIELPKVLNPAEALRIPPPDFWLAANEGELVPWGWLNRDPSERIGTHPPYSDPCFWQQTNCREDLVKWVQEIFHYEPPPPKKGTKV